MASKPNRTRSRVLASPNACRGERERDDFSSRRSALPNALTHDGAGDHFRPPPTPVATRRNSSDEGCRPRAVPVAHGLQSVAPPLYRTDRVRNRIQNVASNLHVEPPCLRDPT
jgi:hypothetical protein